MSDSLFLALLFVGLLYLSTQISGYANYKLAKNENEEHKRWHRKFYEENGWKGKDLGAPPPPCPKCCQDTVYYP